MSETKYHTHHLDAQTYIGKNISALSAFSAKSCKAGVIFDAAPQAVVDYFASISDDGIKKFINRRIPINVKNGELESGNILKTMDDNALDFIRKISKEFNRVGDWPAYFSITLNRETLINSARFHFDGVSLMPGTYEEESTRLITTISDIKENQTHETEVLMTKFLTNEELQSVFMSDMPFAQLSEHVRKNILVMKSGDFYFSKGIVRKNPIDDLTKNHIDQLRTECGIHRGPTQQVIAGGRRVALIWDRDVKVTPDLD